MCFTKVAFGSRGSCNGRRPAPSRTNRQRGFFARRLRLHLQRDCVRPRRGGGLVFERLHLSAASRFVGKRAEAVVLSDLQKTDPLAPESAALQLAFAARPLRKLR